MNIILHNSQSPGDIVASTVAIHCLHKQYPNQYLTDYRCCCAEILKYNPNINNLTNGKNIQLHCDAVHESDKRRVHLTQAYCEHLEKELNIKIKCDEIKPFLYLSPEEKKGRIIKEKYWCINCGYKTDYTTKAWSSCYFQEVINHFKNKIKFIQIGELSPGHMHPNIDGVIDMRGKTTHRQLMQLTYHSQGCLTTISYLHHIAAAFSKPCVTLVPGFEPIHWGAYYPTTRILSLHGALSCCKTAACWKARVIKLNDGSKNDNSLCKYPYEVNDQPIAKCMALITPQKVITAIEEFEGYEL